MQGSRPIDYRRTTFGQRATSDRPASFWSTPRRSYGNAQSPSQRELPGPRMTSEPYLFQWFPQVAIHARATQTSPKQPHLKRKGHKRSNVIRMSNLSRPTSRVDIIAEEPEEVSHFKCNDPRYSSSLGVEIVQGLVQPNHFPVEEQAGDHPALQDPA